MSQHPTDAPSDLTVLRERYPDWFFTSIWAAAASGPDRRMLVAQQHRVVLSGFTAEVLAAKIAAREGQG